MNPMPFGQPVLLSTRRRPPQMPTLERLIEIYATAVYDHWMSPSSGDPGVDTSSDDVGAGVMAVFNAILEAQTAIVHHSKTIFDDVDATLDTTLVLPNLDDYDDVLRWFGYLKGEVE